MNKYLYFILGLMGIITVACSSEHPVGPDIFNLIYSYEVNDTVVSADTHKFSLSMTGDSKPKDWEVLELKVWQGAEIPDIDLDNIIWEKPNDYFNHGDTFGVDWITFRKTLTSTSPELTVSVEQNTSKTVRASILYFGHRNGNMTLGGCLIIIQKPMPDMEPFIMKIRYKNSLYSTIAHLNVNDEIEYDNQEFSDIMNEIDRLKNVEAVVLEDDIVDFDLMGRQSL